MISRAQSSITPTHCKLSRANMRLADPISEASTKVPRGGRRPNSGRRPGSTNKKKSYAIVKAAFASGEPVPLEVMLEIMRFHWREWEKGGDKADLKEAGMLAQAAAPYMHPRLAAIDQRSTLEAGDTLSALLRQIDGKSLGITNGAASGSPLATGELVHMPVEERAEDSVQAELGADEAS
jgi:hypothetical protein